MLESRPSINLKTFPFTNSSVLEVSNSPNMGYRYRKCLLIIIFTILFSYQLASATRPLHGRHEFKNQTSLFPSLMAGVVPPSDSSPCSHIPDTATCVDQVNDVVPFAHPPPPTQYTDASTIDSAAASVAAVTEKQHPSYLPPIEPLNGEEPFPGTQPPTPFGQPTLGEKPSPENKPANGTVNLLHGEKSAPEHQPPAKGKKPPHYGHNPSHPPAEGAQDSPTLKVKPPSIPMKKSPTPIQKPTLKPPFPTQTPPQKLPSPTRPN